MQLGEIDEACSIVLSGLVRRGSPHSVQNTWYY